MLRTKTDTPWTARPSGDGDGLWTVEDANGGIVFFGMEEERAKLFAAAPELLAALRKLMPANVGRLPATTPDSTTLSISVTAGELRKAMAAIALAEGSAK